MGQGRRAETAQIRPRRLDRKIQAEIAPKQEEADGVENKQAEANSIEATTTDAKKSLVAEPIISYYPPMESRNVGRRF